MKWNDDRYRMWWRIAAGTLALLIMVTIGTALAAVPTTTAYHFSSHPMISGTVISVNDHQMVVDTDQGERVTLEMDAGTMAPRDLAPGMVMRAQFLAQEDCRLYAQRIMAVRDGMSTDRRQAYANTRDSREAMAHDASATDGGEMVIRPVSQERLSGMVSESSHVTTMTAIPNTADYRFSTRPMISGKVVAVNDHRLVVETDQGRQVAMVMDSRTMVPGEIAPGTFMRAEFSRMKDGRYYAKQIRQIGKSTADREQAYAHTRDRDAMIARNTSDCGFVSGPSRNVAASATSEQRGAGPPNAVVAQSAPVPVVESAETLPQTASNQPLILLLGLFALGFAGLIMVVRGFRFV